jgi:acyl-CoA synthetase (AMP-forming)/AMP-acid ligase II
MASSPGSTSLSSPASIACAADIVRYWTSVKPNDVSIKFGEESVTWAELDRESSRVGAALVAAGIAPQQSVAFLEKNDPSFFEVIYGTSKANVVDVSVNWRLAPPEILYTVNDAQAKILFVGADFFGAVESIESQLTSVETIVALGTHSRWPSYADWKGAHDPVDPAVACESGDTAFQLYTSGTTGLPKGVMTSNSNLFSLLTEVTGPWKMDETSKNVATMPLFHIGGSGWAMCGQYVGAQTLLVRDPAPQGLLDLMHNEKATNAFYVPALLGFMALVQSQPGQPERDFSSMRSVVYGASPITNDVLIASMHTLKCPHVQVFGMTETTGAITELTPEDHDPTGPRAHLLRSAGKPYRWVEMKVVDLEEGTDCAPGDIGEIWTRSPQNMKGYWGKPEETAKTITPDGWLKTGDAGYMDAEGYLFLTDRVKDMIVSGGENVYPAEVENALASHPSVAEVAVIGVPSDKWGETVKAIVVLKPGSEATQPEIISHAKALLAGYKCPTSVDFIEVLPRNPTGKVLKKDLRAPFWEGRARQIN